MRYETGHLNKAPNEKQLGRGKKKKKRKWNISRSIQKQNQGE
jgi:hypothetical protein